MVGGDRKVHSEPRQRGGELSGISREREAGRVDAHDGQPAIAVAALPRGQIGERADARQVRCIDELDEQRPTGADSLDGAGLGTDPLRAQRKRGYGYVMGLRSHGAGILLASPGGRTRRST